MLPDTKIEIKVLGKLVGHSVSRKFKAEYY